MRKLTFGTGFVKFSARHITIPKPLIHLFMMKRDFRIAYALCCSVSIILAATLFTACKKSKNTPLKEATLTVSLLLPDGTPAAGEQLLLFDEAGKTALDKEPFTAPLTTLTADAQGRVNYTLEVGRWFARQRQREVTVAVRSGVPGNYHLWALTRTIRPGDALQVELRITVDEQPTVASDPATEPTAPGDTGTEQPAQGPETDPSTPTTTDPSTDTPSDPSGGDEPTTPSAEPTQPEEQPATPADPESPATPAMPETPAQPTEPTTPGQSAEGLLTGLSLRRQPTKTTYTLGESLDLTGLAVNGLYSDGSERPLTIEPGWVSGFSSARAAKELTLTVEYEGHRTTFAVTVLPLRIEQGTLTEIQPVGGGELLLPTGVVAIADRAGMFCDAERIVFPEGLRSIGQMAFYGARMTEVVLPASLEELGQEAFYQCSALRRADLSRTTLTRLPARLFAYTGLEEVVWPAGLTEIGRQTFLGTSQLTRLTLPATLQTIALEAFRESALQSVTLPNAIASIESRAFYLCSSLREVLTTGATPTVPQGNLGSSCFERCPALETLTLPGGLVTIGRNILVGNKQVNSIRIPSSVTRVAFGAFDNSALREVYVEPLLPPSVETVSGQWYGFPSNVAAIHVPAGSVAAYREAAGWSSFAGVIQ